VKSRVLTPVYSKRPRYDYLPIDEHHPQRPEDAYSLSKTYVRLEFRCCPGNGGPLTGRICEVQAASIARRHPSMRIASLRFHWVVPTHLVDRHTLHNEGGAWKDLWGWVSLGATAQACLKALTAPETTFPRGHEAFFIAARTTCQQVDSMDLLRTKYRPVQEGIEIRGVVGGNASFIDTRKAERMLGWKEEGFPMVKRDGRARPAEA
jgi:hypothetical protein